MPDCPKCGTHLMRTHRTRRERPFYTAAYRCRGCGHRIRVPHPAVQVHVTFVCSRYTHCPTCGTGDVKRRGKRDSIDTVSNHPLSRLMQLTGAPVTRCSACRVQYYDWRPRKPDLVNEGNGRPGGPHAPPPRVN